MNSIKRCDENDYLALADVWERSVRATHTFLSEEDITGIRQALVPLYFPAVELYGIEAGGALAGFIGLSGEKIEMLFIDDRHRGNGLGSRLIDHAVALGARSVDVNEQNPLALGFYLSKGFTVDSRNPLDADGRPFPILHLSLKS